MKGIHTVKDKIMEKHKVFISYHHFNDQQYKNDLEEMNIEHVY